MRRAIFIAHDDWYARSVIDTVLVAEGQKLAQATTIPGVRGRDYMIPAEVILQTGSSCLRDKLRSMNEVAVRATLQALVDGAAGTAALAVPDDEYVPRTKQLVDHLGDTVTPDSVVLTRRQAQRFMTIAQEVLAFPTDAPISRFSLDTRNLLALVHDRFVQARGDQAPPDQLHTYWDLTLDEQLRDIPMLVAVLYSLFVEAGLVDAEVALAPLPTLADIQIGKRGAGNQLREYAESFLARLRARDRANLSYHLDASTITVKFLDAATMAGQGVYDGLTASQWEGRAQDFDQSWQQMLFG